MKRILLAAALLALGATPAPAMRIREFRKFTQGEQSLYIGAAVSMLVYTYASQGEPRKARCIQDWYYGELGKETPGPRAITLELLVAERADPDKYEVEGVILGLTDRVCAPRPNPRP